MRGSGLLAWGTPAPGATAASAPGAVRLVMTALAAAAFGVGVHRALAAPEQAPTPALYAAWVWPEGDGLWGPLAAALGRQLAWGAAAAWLFGLSVVASPLAVGAAVLRSYTAGIVLGSALVGWGPRGVPLLALSALPAHLLGLYATLGAAGEALAFAAACGRSMLGASSVWLPAAFGAYCRAGLRFLGATAAAAAVEVLGVSAARLLLGFLGWEV